jgi:hypothetical protein
MVLVILVNCFVHNTEKLGIMGQLDYCGTDEKGIQGKH